MSIIGENIKYLRTKMDISQEELANVLGYKSYTTITKWESGVSEPTLKMANTIAEYFNISVNELCYMKLWLGESSKNEETSLIDPDIRRIQRARKNMPEEDKKFMMDMLIRSFGEFFEDDGLDDPD
jgi:transcriptional regulator with XRE-family HTH domain